MRNLAVRNCVVDVRARGVTKKERKEERKEERKKGRNALPPVSNLCKLKSIIAGRLSFNTSSGTLIRDLLLLREPFKILFSPSLAMCRYYKKVLRFTP